MEPNSWSNYNQHYGRIAHSTGLPSSVNRYDLQLLEQPGLGTLQSSLSPSHAGLTPPRPLPSLPSMGYSHQLHSMSQFLDTVSPLQPSFTPTSHYKPAIPFSQPSYQMDPLLSPRATQDSVLGMSGYIQPSLTPPDTKPVFNPDLHSTRHLSSMDGKSWGSSMPPMSSSPYNSADNFLLSGYQNSPPLTSPSKSSSYNRSQFSTSESSYDRVSSPRSPHMQSPYQSIHSPSQLHESRGHLQHSVHHNPPPRRQEDMLSTKPPMHHDSTDIRYLEHRQLFDYTSRNPTRAKKEVYQDSPEHSMLGNLASLNTSISNQVPFQPTSHMPYSDRVFSEERNKEVDLFDHYQHSSPVLGGGDHINVARSSQSQAFSNNHGIYGNPTSNLQTSPSTDLTSNVSHSGGVLQPHGTNYDPVSPVNPSGDQHNDTFSTISLQDLHTFSSNTNSIMPEQSNQSQVKQDTALLDLSTDYGKSKQKKTKQRKSKSKNATFVEQFTSQVPQTFQQTNSQQQISNQSQQVPFQTQMLPLSSTIHPTETRIVPHPTHDPQIQQLVPGQTFKESSHNHPNITMNHSSKHNCDASDLGNKELPTDYGTQKQNMSPFSQASTNYSIQPPDAAYSSIVNPSPLNSDVQPPGDHFLNQIQSMPASVIHTNPLPVQAIADSTTLPKPKGKRGRKKKQPVMPQTELVNEGKPFKHYPDDSMGDSNGSSNVIKDNAMTKKTLTQINTNVKLPHEIPIIKEPEDRHSNNSPRGLGILDDMSQTGSAVLMTDDSNSCIEKTMMRNGNSNFLGEENMSIDIGLEQPPKENMETDIMNFEEEKTSSNNMDTEVSLSDQLIDAAMEAGIDCPSEPENSTTIEAPKVQVVTSELEFDEDFQHLASPPKLVQENPVKATPAKKMKLSKSSQFLSSFLSFIDGEKSETLSSVVQAQIKRPPMPKYIPDLPRPRRRSVAKEEPSNHNSTKKDTSAFNEDDLNTSQKSPQLTHRSRGRPKSCAKKSGAKPKGKRRRQTDEYEDYEETIGSDVEKNIADKEPSPTPLRRKSLRRAKEAKRKYVEEGSDEEVVEKVDKADKDYDEGDEVTYTTEDDTLYDSDDDPAWRPSAVEKRQRSSLSSRPRHSSITGRRRRDSGGTGKKRKKQVSVTSENELSDSEETDTRISAVRGPVIKAANNTPTGPPLQEKFFQKGTFLIEKRDLANYENYPIWKVSDGYMLQKYELIIEEGEVKHKATLTFSRWTLVMQDEFKVVAAELMSRDKQGEVVSVKEEDRPKPPTDGSLERQYEDDPLVEDFNVYLQILLSQALEPGFLKAIRNSTDDFYIRHMNKLDDLIQTRVSEIEKTVKWTTFFREAIQTRPQYRILDKPNLNQQCQACRRVNETACKSVHMFGVMYDRTELTEPSSSKKNQTSQEVLIGKTAAMFMTTYHSLVHYKYSLFKRCLAKVTIVKESEKTQDNAEILDSCLHNRAWVLKLYEDLKDMLENP